MASELKELGEDPRWSVHALRWINPEIYDTDQPLEAIRNAVASILPGLDRIEKALERFTDLKTYIANPHQFSNLVQVCKRLQTLADHNLLDLLNPKSELSSELKR